MVNELIVEGKSYNGEFIDEDEKIEVIRIDTYQIQVVRKTETERGLISSQKQNPILVLHINIKKRKYSL